MRFVMAAAVMSAAMGAQGQQCSPHTGRIAGEVRDTTGALVVGAAVALDAAEFARTDKQGRFASECVAYGPHMLSIEAAGFEAETEEIEAGAAMHPLVAKLKPSAVLTVVEARDADGVDSEDVAGSKTLKADDLKQMADDPDEFARQLQVLAAAAGGAPGQAIVAVDGFQSSGSIPPKSAIAFIRVNPDLFSSEYERPPYQGGRVEIFTKPGQSKLHGALFTTQSAAFLNAKDPFALSRAAIGKQRYGFELSGPIRRNKADFALALEHRQIDQFAVINAVSLDSAGNHVSLVANVPTPQALWEGSARFGWMPNTRNNMTATYTANVNSLSNVGVGGVVLQQAGYDSRQQEHALRFTDLQTLSGRLVHESRVGYTWRMRDDAPQSSVPSLVVAGAFTSGGAATQLLRSHQGDLEIDDDILYTRGNHSMKAGMQLLNTAFHNSSPNNFNGQYVFGGGATISGLEQYRRALLGLPGGTPTLYTVTAGTAAISLDQLRVVLYAQNQWKLRRRLSLSYGLRYAVQSSPTTLRNAGPRLGLAWSPDKAQRWVLHARTGLFFTPVDTATVLEANRLNGVQQHQVQIYNPVYGQPLTTGAATITTVRAPLPVLTQTPSLQSHLGVERDFPGHWHVQANVYLVRGWDVVRSRSINSPQNGQPDGPRPLVSSTNIYQYQQSGTIHGNVMFFGVDQHSLRHVQIFAGYIRMDLRTNADTANMFPQSSGTDDGETARPSWLATHHVIAFTNVSLPKGLSLSSQFDAASGNPYNVTTGFDGNGDGVLNDRPRYATGAEGTLYNTSFGPLTAIGTGHFIRRDAGTLPWNIHLDANLSRSFALPQRDGASTSLVVNVRSTNLLNHTNATAVGSVLGSPLFGKSYAADPGRRVELGLRYNF
jgi:hypothetical protein